MNMKLMSLAWCMYLAIDADAAVTSDEILQQVPKRIQDFREKANYGPFSNTHEELDKKWQYIRFLEQLIKDVNQQVTSGALSPEQIKAIGSFAQLTVILRDDYVPSTFRGSSGFESREVNSMIDLLENVIKDLIPGIGRHLSLFQKVERDWDSIKIDAWLRRFSEAIKVEPGGSTNGNQPIRAETTLQVHAAAEPLIPTPLNDVLFKIRPGITTNQVLAVLSPAYLNVVGRMGNWSGQTGYIDYKLDDRFTLSISSITRDGKKVVHDDLLMYLFDWQTKRRIDLKLYDLDGQSHKKPLQK